MEERVPARLTAAQGRRFGFTLGAAFLVLAGIAWWRGGRIAPVVFAMLALPLVLGALAVPTALGPVERAWMAFAERLSRITTPIVMGIVFYLVMTPLGLVMRALGKNPLDHRSARDSFWIERDGKARRSALDRPY